MRVFRTILGMVLLTTGLPSLLAGGGLWAVMQHRDPGGAYSGELQQLTVPGYALVVPDIDRLLHDHAPFTRIGDSELGLSAVTAEGQAFLGLAPSDEVARYLAGVPHSRVDGIDIGTGALPVATTVIPGGHGPATVPGAQRLWTASGTGQIAFNPDDLDDRPYSLVVMSPVARPIVRLAAIAEVRPGWLGSGVWGFLTLGTLLAMGGVIALSWPGRRREVVYVVEPSQVPELMHAIGAPLPLPGGTAYFSGGRGGAHRPRTLADSRPSRPPALPQFAWPPNRAATHPTDPAPAIPGSLAAATISGIPTSPAPASPGSALTSALTGSTSTGSGLTGSALTGSALTGSGHAAHGLTSPAGAHGVPSSVGAHGIASPAGAPSGGVSPAGASAAGLASPAGISPAGLVPADGGSIAGFGTATGTASTAGPSAPAGVAPAGAASAGGVPSTMLASPAGTPGSAVGETRSGALSPAPGQPLSLLGDTPALSGLHPGPGVDRRSDRRRPTPSDLPEFRATAVGAWVAATAPERARQTEARAAARLAEAARRNAGKFTPTQPGSRNMAPLGIPIAAPRRSDTPTQSGSATPAASPDTTKPAVSSATDGNAIPPSGAGSGSPGQDATEPEPAIPSRGTGSAGIQPGPAAVPNPDSPAVTLAEAAPAEVAPAETDLPVARVALHTGPAATDWTATATTLLSPPRTARPSPRAASVVDQASPPSPSAAQQSPTPATPAIQQPPMSAASAVGQAPTSAAPTVEQAPMSAAPALGQPPMPATPIAQSPTPAGPTIQQRTADSSRQRIADPSQRPETPGEAAAGAVSVPPAWPPVGKPAEEAAPTRNEHSPAGTPTDRQPIVPIPAVPVTAETVTDVSRPAGKEDPGAGVGNGDRASLHAVEAAMPVLEKSADRAEAKSTTTGSPAAPTSAEEPSPGGKTIAPGDEVPIGEKVLTSEKDEIPIDGKIATGEEKLFGAEAKPSPRPSRPLVRPGRQARASMHTVESDGPASLGKNPAPVPTRGRSGSPATPEGDTTRAPGRTLGDPSGDILAAHAAVRSEGADAGTSEGGAAVRSDGRAAEVLESRAAAGTADDVAGSADGNGAAEAEGASAPGRGRKATGAKSGEDRLMARAQGRTTGKGVTPRPAPATRRAPAAWIKAAESVAARAGVGASGETAAAVPAKERTAGESASAEGAASAGQPEATGSRTLSYREEAAELLARNGGPQPRRRRTVSGQTKPKADPALKSAASGTGAPGNGATGTSATGNGATGTSATGNGATETGATGNGAAQNGADKRDAGPKRQRKTD